MRLVPLAGLVLLLALCTAAWAGDNGWRYAQAALEASVRSQHTRAVSLYTKAINRCQDCPNHIKAWLYYNRSLVYEESMRLKKSYGDMLVYADLCPDDPEGLARLARLRQALESSDIHLAKRPSQ